MTDAPAPNDRTGALPFALGRFVRAAGASMLVLAAFGMLLLGRYDWSGAAHPFSLRGYASSLYLVWPTLVTVYCAVRLLRPDRRRNAVIVTVSVGLLLTLPYRWLGLDGLHEYRARPVGYLPERLFSAVPRLETDRNEWGQPTWENAGGVPPADWRPALVGRPGPAPGEGAVPAAIGAVALMLLVVLWIRRSRPPRGVPSAIPWLVILLALALQAWAHVSLRSPYTYVTHHYLPLESNYWHVAFLLGPSEGAVNGDVVVFQELEQHFWGTPRTTDTMLLRRPMVHWVAGQLTFFFNVFHVYLALNLGLWLLAVACLFAFVRDECDRETAWYVALLAACGPGFVMYVAQPTSYLAGYATVAVTVWAIGRVSRPPVPFPPSQVTFLAGVLGLGLLVYDVFAWLVFVLLFGLWRGVPWRPLSVALASAVAVYAGFAALQTRALGIALDATNSKPLADAAHNILSLATGLRLVDFGRLTLALAGDYTRGLATAFFVLPVLLAVVGLALCRDKRATRLALLLLLPSLLGTAFLSYGQAVWGTERLAAMPRFTYVAFPGIYLLAALGLRSIRRRLADRGSPGLAHVVVGLAIVTVFVLASLDVLAGLPQPYYWFYWSRGGHF